jgi:hypothetical protein
MFDDMAMYELLARMEELFYRPENSQGDRDEMTELAAEIVARVANSSI